MRNAAFLAKAENWRRFVKARDAYKSARAGHPEDSSEVQAASRAMQEAYLHWNHM